MRTLAIAFTNFGPYHLARLRALAHLLEEDGTRLIAYETAGVEGRYPWMTTKSREPFEWRTLFADRRLEDLSSRECAHAITSALADDDPDAVAIVGYARPESHAALKWCEAHRQPRLLLSETQEIDHPRVWWKEAIKRQRVMRYSAGLVGGPRHRDYLIKLGMPAAKIALGYDAVDNARFAQLAGEARQAGRPASGVPARPYFLSVNRFVPEKNLTRLIDAYSQYRSPAKSATPWDLVLCGAGECQPAIERHIADLGLTEAIHLPGFLQDFDLAPYYAFASAFVHPSVMEPWGLVVNEAAVCGLPLLVSDRAGSAQTLVADPPGTSGFRFDPYDVDQMTQRLEQVAHLPEADRLAMGARAAALVAAWGPDRFARGVVEAWQLAEHPTSHTLRTRSEVTR